MILSISKWMGKNPKDRDEKKWIRAVLCLDCRTILAWVELHGPECGAYCFTLHCPGDLLREPTEVKAPCARKRYANEGSAKGAATRTLRVVRKTILIRGEEA